MLRVAMIARAWRTPLGHAIDDVIARLCAGERAAIANPKAEGFAVTACAPILGAPKRSKHDRFLRRMGTHAMDVACEALAASGIAPGPRVGLFAGVGGLRAHWDDMLAALANQRDDGEGAWERGLRDVHPYWMLRHLSNNVHALASVELGLRGEGVTFGGGTAGAQAIAAATRALHDGAIDAALVVAYDSLLEPETLVELGARRAATHTAAGQVVAPYAPHAAGYVPGEAAAAIVLVRPSDAATSHALVTAVDGADGEPADPRAALLDRVLSAVAPPETRFSHRIACVDGAARGWPELDGAERATLADHVDADVPLTAIAAAMGQLGAAHAVVQAIALAETLRRGTLPPIAGLASPSPGPCRPLTDVTPTSGGTAIALSTSAPGLGAAVRVEVR